MQVLKRCVCGVCCSLVECKSCVAVCTCVELGIHIEFLKAHAPLHARTCTYTHTCTQAHAHAHVHASTRTCTRTCTCTRVRACVRIHTHTHTHTGNTRHTVRTHRIDLTAVVFFQHTRIYTHTTPTHIHTHIHTRTTSTHFHTHTTHIPPTPHTHPHTRLNLTRSTYKSTTLLYCASPFRHTTFFLPLSPATHTPHSSLPTPHKPRRQNGYRSQTQHTRASAVAHTQKSSET